MWKEPFLLATQIKLLIFLFTCCLHRQKLLLFLSKPGFSHQNVVFHYQSAALPEVPKVWSNKGRWHQVPMLEVTLKSMSSVDMNVKSWKADRPSIQIKQNILKKRRGGVLSVVFFFFSPSYFVFAGQFKKRVIRIFFQREFTQAVFMLRMKKITGLQEVGAVPAILAAGASLHPFTTEFLPTAGDWEPSPNTTEKLHVRTGCAADNLCSVKQTRLDFKKEKEFP